MAVTRKRKIKRTVPVANAYIKTSYNNVLVTIADNKGNVLVRSSAGGCGFRGTKKSTPYAGQIAAETAMELAEPYGIEKINVFIKGIGPGREQAIRGLATKYNIELLQIVDTTPTPHNGCRPKKRRRP